MMRIVKSGATVLAMMVTATVLSACIDRTDTHRWSTVRQEDGDNTEVDAVVYAAPVHAEAEQPPNMRQLSDRGQAEYINAVARRANSSDALREALAAPLVSPNSEAAANIGRPVSDRLQRDLVITLSRPGDYQPGDRIMRAVLHVRPINFLFAGYTIVKTDRSAFDVANVQRNSSVAGTLTVTPGPAAAFPTPISGSATVNTQQSLATTATLRENPELLTPDIRPTCLRIVREGSHNVDLTGNTLVRLTVQSAATPTVNRDAAGRIVGGIDYCGLTNRDADGLGRENMVQGSDLQQFFVIRNALQFNNMRPVPPSHGAVGGLELYPTRPLEANVTLEYWLRRIIGGASSYDEGDQNVALVHGRRITRQVILGIDDIAVSLYGLIRYAPGQCTWFDFETNYGRAALIFTDYVVAQAFASWLTRDHPAAFAGLRLNANAGGASYQAARFTPGSPPPGCHS
jgi:hypothetical protein